MFKYYYYYKSLYKGELLKKIKYYFKRKFGFYRLKKSLLCKYEIKNLNLINKNILKSIDNNLFFKDNLEYNFLNNFINIKNIDFFNNGNKLWINEKLSDYDDVKNTWEINRLQFLLPLSIHSLNNEDEKKLKIVNDVLNEWVECNPYNYGINWFSNLEVAVRCITIYLLYELLDKKISFDFKKCLFEHGNHIFEEIDYSYKCTPNNHIFGEATALLLLGKAFNNVSWIKKAIKFICIFDDIINDEGVSKEGSFSYQFFITQMFLIISSLNINNLNYEKKLQNSINFIYAVTKPNGRLVNFGDNDEGYFYNFFWNKNILNFFKHTNVINSNINLNSFDIKNYYSFQEYKIIKNDNIFMLFNSQKESNHSHSDNLSIELTLFGYDILVDSGTYIYNGNKELRKYFRSSKAHNTISFNNMDHSLQVGTFRWINTCQCYFTDEKLQGILIQKDNKFIRKINIYDDSTIINDIIISKTDYILNWHFSPSFELKEIDKHTFSIGDIFIIKIVGTDLNISLEKSFISLTYNQICYRYNLIIKSKNDNEITTTIKKI